MAKNKSLKSCWASENNSLPNLAVHSGGSSTTLQIMELIL